MRRCVYFKSVWVEDSVERSILVHIENAIERIAFKPELNTDGFSSQMRHPVYFLYHREFKKITKRVWWFCLSENFWRILKTWTGNLLVIFVEQCEHWHFVKRCYVYSLIRESKIVGLVIMQFSLYHVFWGSTTPFPRHSNEFWTTRREKLPDSTQFNYCMIAEIILKQI